MARYGVSIEKEIDFRGLRERISNTYYYELGAAVDNTSWGDLVRSVVNAEKPVHANNVRFKLGRVWEAGGTAIDNEQLALIDLDEPGTMVGGHSIAAELAVLVEFECARDDIRGRKVYLRKYLRSQSLPGALNSASLQRAMLTAEQMAPYKVYADDIEAVVLNSGAVMGALVSPTGRAPLSVGKGAVDPALRNRNIRR